MVKAIIFDVDGTLIDSNDLHAKAWVDAFAQYGHHIPFADVRRQIGKGGDQLMPVFMSEAEIARIGKSLQDDRGRIFKERYLPQVVAFPGVRPLIKRVMDDGKKMAIASSAKDDEIEKYKKIAQIDDLIDAIASSDDAERSKPHPDIFLAALDRLRGVTPEEAIAIGDTPYDAKAAGKAGIRTIGVTCGGWSREDLINAGCVAVFVDPEDLLAHYAELR